MVLYDDRTRAEIDLDALAGNLRILRGQVKHSTKVMAMVKADAYGHGAIPVAHELEQLGIDYLGVANIYEASALREAGIHTPILILGYTPAELTSELLRLNVTQAVQSLSHAQQLSRAVGKSGGTIKIHIKLDTGMSRCGIVCAADENAAAQEVQAICTLPGLEKEGIFTHFAASESDDSAYTQMQYALFSSVLDKIRELGVNIPLKHCLEFSLLFHTLPLGFRLFQYNCLKIYSFFLFRQVLQAKGMLKPLVFLVHNLFEALFPLKG